MIYDFGF